MVSKINTLARERGIGAGAWRGNSQLHSERKVGSRGGEEGQAKRASLGEVGASMSG